MYYFKNGDPCILVSEAGISSTGIEWRKTTKAEGDGLSAIQQGSVPKGF
jgi:hypothetical protein